MAKVVTPYGKRELDALAKRYGLTRGQAAALLHANGPTNAVTVAAAVERGRKRAWTAPQPRKVTLGSNSR